REAVLRIAVRHPQKEALEIFAREIAPAGTSWAPGTTGGLAGGRPAVAPLIRLFSFLLPKSEATPRVTVDGVEMSMPPVPLGVHHAANEPARYPEQPLPDLGVDEVTVPLIRIAHGRSGDK